MPPLWQYFLRLQKADERMAAPKGRESRTPDSFSLQISRFLGVRNGGRVMPFMDPSVARHLSASSVAAAAMGAKAMPPLWQYFSRLLMGAVAPGTVGPTTGAPPW
jgi:hypothetical protein